MNDIIWWDHVTGPSRLVKRTAEVLLKGQSVCLIAQGGIRFRSTFLSRVANALRKEYKYSSLLLPAYVIENVDNPEDYLIEKFGLEAEYRPPKLKTDFLREKQRLKDNLTPVVIKNHSEISCWFKFIKSYKSNSPDTGLFLLEMQVGNETEKSSSKYLQILNYGDFITEYDSLLFAGLITNDTECCCIEEKQYLAAMAVSFFGTNVEGIDRFVHEYKIEQSPFDAIQENYFTDKDSANKRLWKAQLKELFPLIMSWTHDFIGTWRKNIEDALKYITESRSYPNALFPNGLSAYGDKIISPDEMELATLYSLMCKKRVNRDGNVDVISKYVLDVPDHKDRCKQVEFLRNMRNKIAHGDICQPDEIKKLLEIIAR
jgi:hypothetical protein